MKKENITEKELNCRDNGYIDHIDGEQWKTLDEYPNYIISNMGRIFSKNKNRLLKPYFCPYKKNKLYYYVSLTNKYGKSIRIKLHKIVAMAFSPNVDSKKIVHHIDGNELNNKADNLVWLTAAEHMEIHRKMKSEKGYIK